MRSLTIVFVIVLLSAQVRDARAIDPYEGNDPYWVLLHEPAVVEELKLSELQKTSYTKRLDELDVLFFPLRNRSRDEAMQGSAKIIQESRNHLKSLLQPSQQRRLNEILLQFLGSAALLRDDVATELRLTESQRKRIKDTLAETDAANLETSRGPGEHREQALNRSVKLKTDEQKKLATILTSQQQEAVKSLIGPPFAMTKLRRPGFKVPELIDSGEWINTKPIKLDQIHGKVVVVHFYACGCINCIHNYPSYRQWHEQFKGKDVVLIGIHTPETSSERELANVQRKAIDERLAFPILIDGKSENWNAWGNSMWPSVYLIDKRGYLRDFWSGELKWQGADGEKYLSERIEALLLEPAL